MSNTCSFFLPMTATIIITTKNRKEDLRRALKSCVIQDISLEVLVMDDGSTDGTSEMVHAEFPAARLERREESKGLIVRRNEAARLASGEVLISIDDDAEFSAPDIVRVALAEFCEIAIAAVAIPFVNVNQDQTVRQLAPDASQIWLTNEYIGTAHAIRKDVFIQAGGYREVLFHQGEEGDLCIRLLNAGYFVRLGNSQPIFHHESPKRSLERINVFGQRNLILFAWFNVPFFAFPIHLAATIWNGLKWGVKNGCLNYRMRGTVKGLLATVQLWNQRQPIKPVAYQTFRRLKKSGPIPLQLLSTK
jgi:glycosyltransferase involved in cell wall biosynthesis